MSENMAFLFQLAAMAKEKQYTVNLLQVSLRLLQMGKEPLGEAVSLYFRKKEMAPDGSIKLSARELSGLEEKIGKANYRLHVSPLLKEVPETAEPQATKKKSGFY